MRPICGKCGNVMTPQDSRIRPELFLHDACLPHELRPPKAPEPKPGEFACTCNGNVCRGCLLNMQARIDRLTAEPTPEVIEAAAKAAFDALPEASEHGYYSWENTPDYRRERFRLAAAAALAAYRRAIGAARG